MQRKKRSCLWGPNSRPSRYSTTLYHTKKKEEEGERSCLCEARTQDLHIIAQHMKTAPYHGARSKLFNSERTSWEHYYVGLAQAHRNNDYSENGVHICIVIQLSCVHMSRFWACVVVQVANGLKMPLYRLFHDILLTTGWTASLWWTEGDGCRNGWLPKQESDYNTT